MSSACCGWLAAGWGYTRFMGIVSFFFRLVVVGCCCLCGALYTFRSVKGYEVKPVDKHQPNNRRVHLLGNASLARLKYGTIVLIYI